MSSSHTRHGSFWPAVVALALFCAVQRPARASIISISPFVGGLSETWESRNNYETPSLHFEPNPTTIMGGAARLSSPDGLGIYQPGVADFSFGNPPIPAKVSDGVKGLAVNGGPGSATITLISPVSDFGAYWGSGSPSNGISIKFFDQAGAQIGGPISFSYTRNGSFSGGDGGLDWHGWHSTTPIKSLIFSGDYPAIDGLQANVPEPTSTSMLLVGACVLGFSLESRVRRVRFAPGSCALR